MNAVIIILLGIIFKKVAHKLTNWENHRYQLQWEASMATKTYFFEFVNSYIALFSIAFYDQDFNHLA